jgi:hypothetical protein
MRKRSPFSPTLSGGNARRVVMPATPSPLGPATLKVLAVAMEPVSQGLEMSMAEGGGGLLAPAGLVMPYQS